MSFRDMTKEQLAEEALIDISFAILEERRESLTFQDLKNELKSLLGLSDEDMDERSLQFYTDMNIDGRFLAIDGNRWGLREWYPVEQIEEETAPTVKIRKKKAKALDDDELEEELDEDEILFEEDFDEFVEDEEVEDEEDLDFDEEDELDEIEEIEEDLIDDDEDLEILEDDDELAEDEEEAVDEED